MKNHASKLFAIAVCCTALLPFTACKNNTDSTTDSTVVAPLGPEPAAARVTIGADEQLANDVISATKAYPSVQATVENNEITLRGTIHKDSLPILTSRLERLNSTKIHNKLTIKQ